MSPIFPIAQVDPRFRLYTASTGQTEFAVPFPWQNNVDIVVWRFDLDGDQFVLNEAEHYQLSGAGDPAGGTMTLVEGVEALEGEQFLILGDVQLTRAGSIVQGGRFRSRSTDDDLDRTILIAQEIYRELGRTLRTAYGVSGAEVDVGADNVLPVWRNGRLEAGPVWGEELGIPGPGVASGGTAAQYLVKVSGVDYDSEWRTLAFADVGMSGVASVATPAAADEVLLLETSVAGARLRWSLTDLQEWIRTKLGAMISASGAKSTPVDGDQIGISDSAASNGPAKLSFLNAWANYFKVKADAIYAINGIGNTHTALQIELGHATDTTLSRAGAGLLAVEGENIYAAKLVAAFTALHNQPPASNFATLDTRNSHPVLDFDTTTQETAIFAGALPSNYKGNGLTVRIIAALTSATTGTLGWDAAFERDDTGLDIDADSFATAKVATAATVPATSGATMIHTLSFSNSEIDGLQAGEPFRLRIRRDVANDTAAGDAELLRVTVEMT